MTSFSKHQPLLERALRAVATREYFAPFVESPSAKLHPEGAKEAGRLAFEARLGKAYTIEQPGEIGESSEEVSPYTGEPLGIRYPVCDPGELIDAANHAFIAWNERTIESRVAICMEILERLSAQVFENAYATMHTSGQAFMMAFAGSGANSLDRGLEAIAYAYKAMEDVPKDARYTRTFGRE